MEWTNADLEYLRNFRNVVDSDDIKIKEQIKKKLISNRYIAHVLHNTELEDADAEPDEYFGINILPYYLINPTQHNVNNFICYEVSYDELERYNKQMKYLEITFHVLCNHMDLIDKETSLARHDLLAALIMDQFNWTNIFGAKIHLVSDKASVQDTNFAARTLIFQQITDNNIVKTSNGVTKIINKDIVQ